MDWDDTLYLILLIGAIVPGFYLRNLQNPHAKQWISTFLGIAIVITVSGFAIWYLLLGTLINIIIIFYVDKSFSHYASFIFSFLYLAFCRNSHYLGFVEVGSHLNAIEMLHTLKIVGLAYELQDSYVKKNNEAEQSTLKNAYTKINPSFLDIFHYSFCYIGLLAGPYFKFRTYWDWLNMPYASHAPVFDMVFNRLKVVPFYSAAFLIGNYFYPLQYTENEIYHHSFMYRWWYMTPLFFNFRMRLYIGFILSECACIAAGLGIYPSDALSKPGQGPVNYMSLEESSKLDDSSLKTINYDYETVHNIDEYGSEMVATVREGMKCWNMTVQYWLAVFVYKQVKKFRVALTMLTSAFWHGVYPGYYLCLLTVPFELLAEASMDRALRRDATPQGKRVYDWICWIFKMQAFAYMGMAFYLLDIKKIMKFWYSFYFAGHMLIVFFFCLGHFIRHMQRLRSPASKTKQQEKENLNHID